LGRVDLENHIRDSTIKDEQKGRMKRGAGFPVRSDGKRYLIMTQGGE